jgi:hypothetical protein
LVAFAVLVFAGRQRNDRHLLAKRHWRLPVWNLQPVSNKISFGLAGCTSVHDVDKFPPMSQRRTHQDNFWLSLLRRRIRSQLLSRALDKFPLKSLWHIHD